MFRSLRCTYAVHMLGCIMCCVSTTILFQNDIRATAKLKVPIVGIRDRRTFRNRCICVYSSLNTLVQNISSIKSGLFTERYIINTFVTFLCSVVL